uniref:Uncharacterized protein n=1 Tax=Octactis speculum TaxID=3111310 RepID=A0A7S2GL25_9STRA|mmetsp:Transcript_5001/g.6063  ORF Transcript_5001/g.6063 Transcript_5001/m.6063 type:complete len:115 (+) Transcript_5001:281-625(+)
MRQRSNTSTKFSASTILFRERTLDDQRSHLISFPDQFRSFFCHIRELMSIMVLFQIGNGNGNEAISLEHQDPEYRHEIYKRHPSEASAYGGFCIVQFGAPISIAFLYHMKLFYS